MPAHHGHRRPARPAQAARGRRPPRHRRQRAGDVLPARGRPRLVVGRRADPARRRGARHRDLDRERRGPARPRHQHQALAAVRPQLRVPLRGPDRLGRARRGDRERHPVEGRGHLAQALRREQPGERPHAVLVATSTRGRCARSTCAGSSASSRTPSRGRSCARTTASTACTRRRTRGC